MRSSVLSRPLPFLLLVTFTALAFLPGLGGGFVFDDYNNIVLNTRLHLESLDLASLERATQAYTSGVYGRPLATLSFAFDFYLHGKSPWGFKLSSLFVHLANAGLVFLLVRQLLSRAWSGTPATHTWAAAAVALAWAAHPLQVSTVLYVVQRMESLAVFFMLLALWAYVRARLVQIQGEGTGLGWLLASVLASATGLLSKETAALTPLLTLALELTLFRFEARDGRIGRGLKWAYGIGLASALAAYLILIVPHYGTEAAYINRDFTVGERLLTQLRVLPMYLGQCVLPLPSRLTFYYDDLVVSTGLFAPMTTALGALLLAALLVLAWRFRSRAPLAALGVFWFFAAHALTSNVLNLELAFEHRNYLALLGVVLVAAEGLHRWTPPSGRQSRQLVAVVLLAGLVGLTAIRAATWGNPLTLAGHLAAINPQSPRAANDLATEYADLAAGNADSRFFQLSLAEFERAAALPNASPLPEQGLLVVSALAGVPADPAWWDSLVAKVKAQPPGAEQKLAVVGLMERYQEGVALDRHRLSEAYQALLGKARWPGFVYAQFADFALTELDDPDLSERMFVMAVRADPSDAEFAGHVLATLVSEGHVRQADAVARTMIELGLLVDGTDAPGAK